MDQGGGVGLGLVGLSDHHCEKMRQQSMLKQQHKIWAKYLVRFQGWG